MQTYYQSGYPSRLPKLFFGGWCNHKVNQQIMVILIVKNERI